MLNIISKNSCLFADGILAFRFGRKRRALEALFIYEIKYIFSSATFLYFQFMGVEHFQMLVYA